MLFRTPQEKERFFAEADQNPSPVKFGSALLHALGTNLGVWGTDLELLEETARIMKYEIARVVTADADETSWQPSEDSILASSVFIQIYRRVRSVAQKTLIADLRNGNGMCDLADQLERDRKAIDASVKTIHGKLAPEIVLPMEGLQAAVRNPAALDEIQEEARELAAHILNDVMAEAGLRPRQALRAGIAHG